MNWKALYVASRAEKKVCLRLINIGIEAYVPLKKEKKQWSDRKKIVISPLINGYVFVKTNEKNRDLVFKSPGVIQYLRYNGEDAIVRDVEIDILKSIEEKGYYAEAKPSEKLLPGQRTQILHGPFKGMTGIVEHKAGNELYTITLESIGYTLKINLQLEVLIKK